MSRYVNTVPTADQVAAAVSALFASAAAEHPEGLLAALLPVDRTMERGFRVFNAIPSFEMGELCRLGSYFDTLQESERDEEARSRIRLLVYCHVMEADFPITVIWNVARILTGLEPGWTFVRRSDEKVLRHPGERIAELVAITESTELHVGSVLQLLWQRRLRNAFSHSQYFFAGESITCSERLSPIGRSDERVGPDGSDSYAHVDLEDLYAAAVSYLRSFARCYQDRLAFFRDGQPHQLADWEVRWDGDANRWQRVET